MQQRERRGSVEEIALVIVSVIWVLLAINAVVELSGEEKKEFYERLEKER